MKRENKMTLAHFVHIDTNRKRQKDTKKHRERERKTKENIQTLTDELMQLKHMQHLANVADLYVTYWTVLFRFMGGLACREQQRHNYILHSFVE